MRIPGDGTGTPIIVGDQVFIQTAVNAKGDGQASAAESDPQPKGKGPPPVGEKGKKGFGPPKGGKGGPPGGFGGGKGGKGGFGDGPPPTDAHQFILLCLDKSSGKTVWQKVCREEVPHEGFRAGHGSFAAASALSDGESVYAFFGSRGLYCYDLAGNLKWEKDLGDQQTRNDFGEGATPAVFGNTIVVPWDHEEEDFIVALDKRTGDELWRQPRDEPTGWATPLIVEHDGKPQIITVGTKRVRSYDLATGKQIWECEGLTTNVIPTPVHANGIVYCHERLPGQQAARHSPGPHRRLDRDRRDRVARRSEHALCPLAGPLRQSSLLFRRPATRRDSLLPRRQYRSQPVWPRRGSKACRASMHRRSPPRDASISSIATVRPSSSRTPTSWRFWPPTS